MGAMRTGAGVLIAAALILGPARAWAGPQWGAEVFGAFNTYAMGEVNDYLAATHRTAGTGFDEIHSGYAGGVGARAWLSPRWMLSLAWEPLFAESRIGGGAAAFNLDAHAVVLGAGWFFPARDRLRLGFAAGLGYYAIGGEAHDGAGSRNIGGDGAGAEGLGVGEWSLTPGLALTAGAGYRYAKVGKAQLVGSLIEREADYSGFIGRLGVAFYRHAK